MITLRYSVTYPKVGRLEHPERELRGLITVKDDVTSREDVCSILFAGFGNHTGNERDWDFPGFVFTTGDDSTDMAHRRWEVAGVRSMSVGDVVTFENSETSYICDCCGWMAVPKVQARRRLDFPRQYGCCSFELRQWKKAEGIDHNTLS
jgi:hypothetical protein